MRRSLKVLVVDDERLSRETGVLQLRKAGHTAEAVDNAFKALDALDAGPWDAMLCDLRMPGKDGLSLLRTVRRDYPEIDVVIMTAYGTVETAVQAMHAGAADYLTKPFHFQELEHRLSKLAELRGYRDEVRALRRKLDTGAELSGLVGRSRAMTEVVRGIETYAGHDASVLITGETGTGKEMVSRALHERGPRASGPFVPVACGAIPGELAESELFGHEKGAFTGATGQRRGAFERADGGTLLLDDVDDLPLAIQAKLLRALQEGRFARIGGDHEISVDVRVIATTKVDLEAEAAAGRFRNDLFYRLRGLELRLPPLAARGDDVLVLAEHFLRAFADKAGRAELGLSPDAAALLRKYPWPGNVRELRSAVESAAIVCQTPTIEPHQLPGYVRAGAESGDDLVTLNLQGRERLELPVVIDRVEQRLIEWALRQAGGQQSRAAELLGIPRTTFQSKLQRGHGDEHSG